MRVDVALVPPSEPPTTQTCLVVDVLRATSVMAVLFGRGLRALYPAGSIEEGLALRARLGAADGGLRDALMLCGERDAVPPPGYDFGNSPSEFERLAAAGALPAEQAVIATSNGTPALLACVDAPLTLAAAPLNAGAVTHAALASGRDVLVVCSGLRRAAAEDDTLAAGLLVERLVRAGAQPGDEAAQALDRFEADRADFAAALRDTEHGRVLVELGFGEDIDFCAQTDRYNQAGALRLEDGQAVLRPLIPTAGAEA